MKVDIFTGVVLVDNKNNIYLIKEEDKNKIGKGRWNLPGGSIDDDESFLDSAYRETLEETGYQSKVGSIVGIYHCCKNGNYWMYIVFGAIVNKKKKKKLVDKTIKSGAWFSKKKFLNMDQFDIQLLVRIELLNFEKFPNY